MDLACGRSQAAQGHARRDPPAGRHIGGDVVKVEADADLDGLTVTTVCAQGRSQGSRDARSARQRADEPLVTQVLAPKGRGRGRGDDDRGRGRGRGRGRDGDNRGRGRGGRDGERRGGGDRRNERPAASARSRRPVPRLRACVPLAPIGKQPSRHCRRSSSPSPKKSSRAVCPACVRPSIA